MSNNFVYPVIGACPYCGKSAVNGHACGAADLSAAHSQRAEDGDIGYLQKVIAQWADEHFPDRTAHDAAVKLVLHEIPEWLRAMDDPLEYADLVILILDIAHLKGIDIRRAVLDKVLINRNRTWRIDPTTRLMQHVED